MIAKGRRVESNEASHVKKSFKQLRKSKSQLSRYRELPFFLEERFPRRAGRHEQREPREAASDKEHRGDGAALATVPFERSRGASAESFEDLQFSGKQERDLGGNQK